MALVLKGLVNGMRAVTGEYQEGDRKGEKWYFLSLEVKDTMYGEIYSCQLPDTDPLYKEFVTSSGEKRDLAQGKDLKGHVVKVTVKKATAGERNMRHRVFKANGEKNIGYEQQAVPVVRFQITNLRDLGLPNDDDE